MLELLYFAPIALLTIASAVLIFAQSRLLYAALALALAFLGSAFVFLLLNQVLIALLQLFIFVGGLSTYLIVAVATEEKGKKLINRPYFAIAAILITASLIFSFSIWGQGTPASNNFLTLATAAFGAGYVLLYALMLLLFSATIGTVLLIRKFVKLVV